MDKLRILKSRFFTQRGEQLPDGRIISLYDEDNKFYLRYDDVIDLENEVIIRRNSMDKLTDDEKAKGYTTMNLLYKDHKLTAVQCYDKCEYDLDVYPDDKNIMQKINPVRIKKFFNENGYDVTLEAINHQIQNWMSDYKSGYRDDARGYHLFSPCGCNPLSIRLSTLHPLCDDWQTTYWC
jgi:hypothetical protein